MERKLIQGICIYAYRDQVAGITYLHFLTKEGYESVRLGSVKKFDVDQVGNIMYAHAIEVIKTKKNWVFSDLIASERLFTPDSYSNFIKVQRVTESLRDSMHVGQETRILSFVYHTLKEFNSLNAIQFQKDLQAKLGFSV